MSDTPRILSAEQASAEIGGAISADALVRAAKEGKIRHYKPPHDGAYMFTLDQLWEYVRQFEQLPKSVLRRGA